MTDTLPAKKSTRWSEIFARQLGIIYFGLALAGSTMLFLLPKTTPKLTADNNNVSFKKKFTATEGDPFFFDVTKTTDTWNLAAGSKCHHEDTLSFYFLLMLPQSNTQCSPLTIADVEELRASSPEAGQFVDGNRAKIRVVDLKPLPPGL